MCELINWSKYARRLFAFTNQGKELGYLKLEVGQHHIWCWYQYKDIGMSPSCLQEVRNMQKKYMEKGGDDL